MSAPTRTIAIDVPHEAIAEFCRKWGIRKLSFFGSVVRDDFTETSDVDVLVVLDKDAHPGLAFFGKMPDELAKILGGRRVDVVEESGLNRWMRKDVMNEAVLEYVEEI